MKNTKMIPSKFSIKKLTYSLFLLMLLSSFTLVSYSQTIKVAMEPFPPFVTEKGEGITIDMLRAIESISDLTFDIQITTYARAKVELEKKRIDIAGHTPKGLETAEFYQYAEELNWQIPTKADLYSFDKRHFEVKKVAKGRIGTTSGNAVFFAEMLNISEDNFIETATLQQLVGLLLKKRIDVIVFERVSTMTLLQNEDVQYIYYQSIGDVPASIAVTRDEKGLKLKKQLDELIEKLDQQHIFNGFLQYTNLSDDGWVPTQTANQLY